MSIVLTTSINSEIDLKTITKEGLMRILNIKTFANSWKFLNKSIIM